MDGGREQHGKRRLEADQEVSHWPLARSNHAGDRVPSSTTHLLSKAIPIDLPPFSSDNSIMSIDTPITAEEAKRELDAVIARMISGVRDREAGRKAREDLERMVEETRQRIGTVDMAVDLVRDARNQ